MKEKEFYSSFTTDFKALLDDSTPKSKGQAKGQAKRKAKFKEFLSEIANKQEDTQPYSRVTLCYLCIDLLYKRFKESGTIDYKEFASYLAEVMGDIEWVAAHDKGYYSDYQKIYRIDNRDFISCIVDAIVDHLSNEHMRIFINSVATIEYNKKSLYNIVNYFRCTIHKYATIKKSQIVADYGRQFMKIYNDRAWCCTTLGVDDFIESVDAIHTDIDVAFKALKIKDAGHEKIMADIRKRTAETPRERQNRKRAELYDQAQRARESGDMDAYQGYSSALGDVGR
ncbi:MAG: hypothetical protein R3Y44_02285 [Rikenellaceae bacterium]